MATAASHERDLLAFRFRWKNRPRSPLQQRLSRAGRDPGAGGSCKAGYGGGRFNGNASRGNGGSLARINPRRTRHASWESHFR